MNDQHGGVVITLGSIYETQQEMLVKLAEIGGTLALQAQQDRNDKAVLVDHESRIRKLEMKVYALPSVATLIALASFAWMVFGQ